MFGYVMPPLQNARGRQMQTAGHLPALIAGENMQCIVTLGASFLFDVSAQEAEVRASVSFLRDRRAALFPNLHILIRRQAKVDAACRQRCSPKAHQEDKNVLYCYGFFH